MNDTERNVSPENILAHTLIYCPNLQRLLLEKWILKRPMTRNVPGSIKTISLEALTFERCIIKYGALQELSHFVHQIDRLNLIKVENAKGRIPEYIGGGKEILQIQIPDIKVNSILLDYKCTDNDPIYVQIYANYNSGCYYRYDSTQANYYKELSMMEYLRLGHHRFIYICCATNPRVTFKFYPDDMDEQ